MMLHIELSDEEREVLAEILDSSLPKLDVEIHRTDKLEFKEALSHRRDIVKQISAKVSAANRAIV
jgi:hypothetical protein